MWRYQWIHSWWSGLRTKFGKWAETEEDKIELGSCHRDRLTTQEATTSTVAKRQLLSLHWILPLIVSSLLECCIFDSAAATSYQLSVLPLYIPSRFKVQDWNIKPIAHDYIQAVSVINTAKKKKVYLKYVWYQVC